MANLPGTSLSLSSVKTYSLLLTVSMCSAWVASVPIPAEQDTNRGGEITGENTSTVFVHQSDQICLSQQPWRLSGSVNHIDGGWLELCDVAVVRDLLVRPLVVHIDLQVVSLQHGQTMGREPLPGDVDVDGRLGSQGVLGDAGQEVSDYELVDPGLVPRQLVGVFDGVDGRMSLV